MEMRTALVALLLIIITVAGDQNDTPVRFLSLLAEFVVLIDEFPVDDIIDYSLLPPCGSWRLPIWGTLCQEGGEEGAGKAKSR
jgi:hypothetical protein